MFYERLARFREPHFVPTDNLLGVQSVPVQGYLLALPSDLKVGPQRTIHPQALPVCEYEMISAFIETSVSAEVVRPTGPVTADASSPQ